MPNIVHLFNECMKSPITEWINGRSRLSNGPWQVYIGVTNLCNLRCRVCARDKAMRQEKGVMCVEIFQKIVTQLPSSVKKVYLMKQGEPFVHPEFEKLVSFLRTKRPDIFISFHTNGVLATRDRVAKILDKVDSIGVSVSSISPETYTEIHGKDAFADVVANLAAMSEILAKMPADCRPHVFIDYVTQRANAHEKREDVVAFFQTLFPEIASVDFHHVYNFQGEIDEGGIDAYDHLDYSNFPTCVWPWSTITFCHDGQVTYCFVEPRENSLIGDISTKSFEQIWNGREYTIFRQKMLTKELGCLADKGQYCHKCSWLWNMRSQSPRNLNGGYASQKKLRLTSIHFGDLMSMARKEVLALGMQYYMEGEIHMALTCFETVTRTAADDTLLLYARTLLRICRKILSRYALAETWEMYTRSQVSQSAYYDRSCE